MILYLIRNRPVLWLLLAGITAAAQAQEIPWDSTARPEIYRTRVELFRTFPQSPQDIVFIGNSITFWADWNELTGSLSVKNRGIPGDITFGLLERLGDVVKGKPAKIFILIGINDLARNIPDDVIINNHLRMVRQIQSGSPATRIYLQTLLPTNRSFDKLKSHYNKEERIRAINRALHEMAASQGCTLVDLYTHFADSEGQLKQEYTWDGVHLTPAGYARWIEILREGNFL